MKTKNFSIIGVGGFVAPRHLQAINDTGNILQAALDPNDSVGVLDSYFPDCKFFTEFERFDRHIHKISKTDSSIDYTSVCSPNYLHDAHIRFGLRSGSNVICEKPLVINPWNLEGISEVEISTGNKLNAILQLRLHPQVIRLKEEVSNKGSEGKVDVNLEYITPRGSWYDASWKGSEDKSGGIVTNIGIHFFDMLTYIFGGPKESQVHMYKPNKASGYLELERANVNWFLSVDPDDLLQLSKAKNKPHRKLSIGDEEFNFSDGFNDLHTESYRQILLGNGFGVNDARPSVELAYSIRTSKISARADGLHPLLRGKNDNS